MKKFMLASVGAILCLYVAAQENVIKPLTIKDTVPDIIFSNLYNHPAKTIRLSDFKGKLVILDFWAAWCGGCVYKLSALDSLQQRYAAKLQIISVNCTKRTKDTPEKIAALLRQWQQANGKTFSPLVVADSSSLFKKMFPHRSIPHYVWISPEGTVAAITGSEELTEQNINALLKGQSPPLPLKNDFLPQPTTNAQ
ncbi:TlpA family protein disulfide reductase [Niabella hirudinis]|uniref:TlpA family protein disulfide reductase n=1 Tax=Niabella hirudinis TaxID=1285929 RepID=UPI003EB7D394